MRNYIIKRILLSILILFCVTFVLYVLMRSLPASFVETMAMQLAQAPGAKPYEEWIAQLNASYGLDLGIVPGYLKWLGALLLRISFIILSTGSLRAPVSLTAAK